VVRGARETLDVNGDDVAAVGEHEREAERVGVVRGECRLAWRP